MLSEQESELEIEAAAEPALTAEPRLAEAPRAPMAAAEGERPRRGGRVGRRRYCVMCADKMKSVDYKDVAFLRRYLSERARIETRRKSSCCAKHQRALARAIKRARHLALLPYTADHMRSAGVGPAR